MKMNNITRSTEKRTDIGEVDAIMTHLAAQQLSFVQTYTSSRIPALHYIASPTPAVLTSTISGSTPSKRVMPARASCITRCRAGLSRVI